MTNALWANLLETTINLFFDGNLYGSIFTKKAIKKPELATQWLGTWRDIDGNIHHDILYNANTNNQAEYGSMLMILKHLVDLAGSNKWLTEAIIYGDSQLVIYQMTAKYKVKEAALKPLWLEALNLVHVLKEEHGIVVRFRWIKRGLNNEALGITSKISLEDLSEINPESEDSHGEEPTITIAS